MHAAKRRESFVELKHYGFSGELDDLVNKGYARGYKKARAL